MTIKVTIILYLYFIELPNIKKIILQIDVEIKGKRNASSIPSIFTLFKKLYSLLIKSILLIIQYVIECCASIG